MRKLAVVFILLLSGTLVIALPTAAQSRHVAVPTPLPDPLDKPLPDTDLPPETEWRAPLYPVPWALGPHDHFYFVRPLAVDEANQPLSSYRYGGTFFAPDVPHTGADFPVPEGTPVMAVGDGEVVWAGPGLLFGDDDEDDPYGIAIAIEHDFGWDSQPLYTLYAHNSAALVKKGERVRAGDVIALSGNTGQSTAPHLHIEIRLGANNYNQTFNPELWLAPLQGTGVIVGKLTDGAGEPLLKQDVILENQATLEEWFGSSYASIYTVNGDPFYQENFAISGLPAGLYKVRIPYFGYWYEQYLQVRPGAVSYFRYRGLAGFSDFYPLAERPANLPE